MNLISESGVSRTTQIKNLIRAHRNELLFELEPVAIISALSRSKTFQKRSLSSICASSSCNKRINDILSLVECGNTDAVESFVAVLKDLGYRDIVDLIDPPSFHTKAGNSISYMPFFCSNTILEWKDIYHKYK